MSKVFIAEPNKRFSFDDAAKFGTITYISDIALNPFQPELVLFQMHSGLNSNKYNPEQDFICMTGNSLILSFMLVTVAQITDSMKLLMFDSRSSSYRERSFKLK